LACRPSPQPGSAALADSYFPRKADRHPVSPELRSWLKGHDTLDFTEPGFDKLLTPDDVLNVPEFLLAYQRTNSGGVTNGLPKPKYTDADKTEHPEKYEKLKQDYLASLKKFLRSRPETMSGVELELDAFNQQRKWAARPLPRSRTCSLWA